MPYFDVKVKESFTNDKGKVTTTSKTILVQDDVIDGAKVKVDGLYKECTFDYEVVGIKASAVSEVID